MYRSFRLEARFCGAVPGWGAEPVMHLFLKRGDDPGRLRNIAAVAARGHPGIECCAKAKQVLTMTRRVGQVHHLEGVRIDVVEFLIGQPRGEERSRGTCEFSGRV